MRVGLFLAVTRPILIAVYCKPLVWLRFGNLFQESVMGYNRSGKRRTERLKRHRRLLNRLRAKEAAKQASAPAKQASPS